MVAVEKGIRKQEVRSRLEQCSKSTLLPSPLYHNYQQKKPPHLLRIAASLSSSVHTSWSISWDYETRLGNSWREEVEMIFFHANKEIWRKKEEKVEPLKRRLSLLRNSSPLSTRLALTYAFFDPYGTPVDSKQWGQTEGITDITALNAPLNRYTYLQLKITAVGMHIL